VNSSNTLGSLAELRANVEQESLIRAIGRNPNPSDQQRRVFNAGVFVERESFRELIDAITVATEMNRTHGRPERRRLVRLEGDSEEGKTALLGMLCTHLMELDPPQWVLWEGNRVTTQPVVFVDCTSGGPKGLMKAVGRALNLKFHKSSGSADDLLDTVVVHIQARRVRVIVFDDANSMAKQTSKEAYTTFLRRALKLMPATMVFAGMDLDSSPLGAKGYDSVACEKQAAIQLTNRTIPVALNGIKQLNDTTALPWVALLQRAASTYLLSADDRLALSREDVVWLHGAVDGHIGRLYEALGTAASAAVGGCEQLTKQGIQQSLAKIR